MINISKFGEDFLKLALRINKHINRYVDFYIGPEKIRQMVMNESIISPNKLLNESKVLLNRLETQGFETKREKYIRKMLIAMKASIEMIIGNQIPLKDLIYNLYDAKLQPVNESELYDVKKAFDNAYESNNRLKDRMAELRILRRITSNNVYDCFRKALDIVKQKTKRDFINLLPENEQIIIELVHNKQNNQINRTYYEWYLGNYCSRIEVNPNYNVYWTSILSTSAHEGYPGHHTEFVIKENILYRKLFQFEQSVLLLNSPKLIISEGIADLALNVLFSYQEQAEIALNEFCPNRLNEDDIDKISKQMEVKRKLDFIIYNIAYFALIEGWDNNKLFKYADSFEILSEEDIKNRIKILNDPVVSTTSFSYFLGTRLIMNKYGEFPSIKDFKELLINPVLPSDLL